MLPIAFGKQGCNHPDCMKPKVDPKPYDFRRLEDVQRMLVAIRKYPGPRVILDTDGVAYRVEPLGREEKYKVLKNFPELVREPVEESC